MKNHKLVLEIPIDFTHDPLDKELQNQKDIEDLYNSHKNILLDLLENLILNDNQDFTVTIKSSKKEEA